MTYSIDKNEVDAALFEFLRSIYLFERRESSMFGVTWDEVYLLQLLIRRPGMRVSHLSQELRIPKFAASRMLTRLQQNGLVLKESDGTDGRAVSVHITEAGREKIGAIEAYNYETVSAHFGTMPEPTLRLLLQTITELGGLLNLNAAGESGEDQ